MTSSNGWTIGLTLCVLGVAGCAVPSPPQQGMAAVMLEEPSLAQYVVYRPQSLETFGPMHGLPVVVWGNGGCSKRGNSAEPFLTEIAAHGYLVIASGTILPAPPPRPPGAPGPGGVMGAGGPPPGAPPPRPEDLTRTAQLYEAIDWATAQDAMPDSPYYGKIDTRQVAAMGTSCGGLQAIEAGPDPRIRTVATWSSGLLDQPRPGANATHDDLKQLHGPILYVVGGPTDGAAPHAKRDFAEVTAVPAVLAQDAPASHGTPLLEPRGGAWAPVAVAWLDWQLKHDMRGATMFLGPDCVLCKQADWAVQTKGF